MDKPITVIKIAVAALTVSGVLGLIAVIVMLVLGSASGQTHTMPGSNVVPSGATLTIQSGGTITAAGGSTVTGFGGGGSPGGSTTQVQYNNSGAFGGISSQTTNGTVVTQLAGANFLLADPTAPTKKAQFDLSNIVGGLTWTVNIPNALSTTAQVKNAVTSNFLTAMSAQGVFTASQPLFSDINGTATDAQIPDIHTLTGIPNLTTNGFVKTGGAVGTLSVDTATYQAADADLTTWAGITPVAAVGTWIATPSSANLRSAMTDENGTGALLFSGATTPDFTTGFTIGAAAASGKILIGNGTNYVPSTPTYPNSASVAGTILQAGGTNWAASTPTWPTAAGTAGYTLRSDGTNFASYPQDMFNSSVTSQATFSTSDIYITNSNVTVAAGDMKAKGQYRCLFDMTKSAGTGAIVVSVRVGTAGAIGDAQILTFTFGAGTAIADTGTFEIIATWRTVGSGTSAVMQGVCRAQKNAATTTGLWNNAGTDLVIVAATSSGFNSSTATSIGVSFNGSTAFAGTSTLCQATLIQ